MTDGFCKLFTSVQYCRCLSGVPQWLRITRDRVSKDGSRIGAVALIRDRKRKRDRTESGGQIPTGDRVWIDGRTMQPEPPPSRPIQGNLRVSTSWGLLSNSFSGRKKIVGSLSCGDTSKVQAAFHNYLTPLFNFFRRLLTQLKQLVRRSISS